MLQANSQNSLNEEEIAAGLLEQRFKPLGSWFNIGPLARRQGKCFLFPAVKIVNPDEI